MAVPSIRHQRRVPPPQIGEPAVCAVIDFQRDPLVTVTEETVLEQALDEMFRWGVRALLVVHECAMTGLITVEHTHGERGNVRSLPDVGGGGRPALRVVDVMTPSINLPAVEWSTIERARIRDLIEIFEESGEQDMVVLEPQGPDSSRVRGLILRDQLVRRLGLSS